MAVDAICTFEYLYGGQLKLKWSEDGYSVLDRRQSNFNIFSKKIDIKVKMDHEYPCEISLIGPTHKIFSCVVEAGDDWIPIWRQILGSFGAAVEYGIDCERVFNRLAVKHRMLLGVNPASYKTLKGKLGKLTEENLTLSGRLQELERENQILRRLLADQILKE